MTTYSDQKYTEALERLEQLVNSPTLGVQSYFGDDIAVLKEGIGKLQELREEINRLCTILNEVQVTDTK